MANSAKTGDRFEAEIDGETVEVFDHVSVAQYHYVNSVNGYETFEPEISKGDMGGGPQLDAVTERVASLLWHEFGIEVENYGIRAVDPDDPDVSIL